jgi:hypothetical protein
MIERTMHKAGSEQAEVMRTAATSIMTILDKMPADQALSIIVRIVGETIAGFANEDADPGKQFLYLAEKSNRFALAILNEAIEAWEHNKRAEEQDAEAGQD